MVFGIFLAKNGTKTKRSRSYSSRQHHFLGKPSTWCNLWRKNFGRTSFKTRVIPALVSFFSFRDPVFWLWARFWMTRPSDGKKLIGCSHAEFYTRHFENKFFFKSTSTKRACPTRKVFGRAITSHILNFRLLLFSGHFRMAKKYQKRFRECRKISCWWRKKN